jgi:hypothetical protein
VNTVIKRGGLGSSYQEGGLGSSYHFPIAITISVMKRKRLGLTPPNFVHVTSQVTRTRVKKILDVDTQYTAKVKNLEIRTK